MTVDDPCLKQIVCAQAYTMHALTELSLVATYMEKHLDWKLLCYFVKIVHILIFDEITTSL